MASPMDQIRIRPRRGAPATSSPAYTDWASAAGRYALSTIQHVVNGFVTVPLPVLQQREALCSSCQHNVNNVCNQCDCPTKPTLKGYKLERPHEYCPVGKWKRWKPSAYDFWCQVIREGLQDDGWPPGWYQLPEVQHAFRTVLQEKLQELAGSFPEDKYQGRGVVILGGGERYGIGVYVTCQMLRHHGWTGPIQVWHRGSEEPLPVALFDDLKVEVTDAKRFLTAKPCRRWGMDKWGDPNNRWLSWGLKSYAVLHCPFREVLYLDADAYPVKPIDRLFDQNRTGMLLWYDLPSCNNNLKWDVYGIQPDAGRGWQGGQWLIDKARCWKALQLYRWLDDWSDYTYRYGYGDQDNLRLAFQATNTPHFAIPYRDEAVVMQSYHGCLRAWDEAGDFVIHHRITDKQFQRDFWKESGFQEGPLRKRNRWEGEDLVHHFARQYRSHTS